MSFASLEVQLFPKKLPFEVKRYCRASMNVLPYEPILSYLLFLKIVYNSALRIFGLTMELKHSNLKVRPGASPQRVAFFGERTVHTGNLLRLVCTSGSNIINDNFPQIFSKTKQKEELS